VVFTLDIDNNTHKMQSETASLTPMPPPGKLDETYALSLIEAYPCIVWKHDIIHKTRSTSRIALLSEEDQATVNITGNLVKFGHMVVEVCGWPD